jgi:hypothetical protein
MRKTLIAVSLLTACSGDPPSEPAGQEHAAVSPASEDVEAAPGEAGAEPEAGPAVPEQPAQLVEGETDGELPAGAAEPGETEGAVAPPPGEEPPPVADANQPAAPDADQGAGGGAVADANLDPAHLEQAREEDMTEREKRAARARAARKAYEQ